MSFQSTQLAFPLSESTEMVKYLKPLIYTGFISLSSAGCDIVDNSKYLGDDHVGYVVYRLHRIALESKTPFADKKQVRAENNDNDIKFRLLNYDGCFPKYNLVFKYQNIDDERYKITKIRTGKYIANRYFTTSPEWTDPVYSFTISAKEKLYLGEFYFFPDGNVVVRRNIHAAKQHLKLDLVQKAVNYIPRPPDQVCAP